jgi:hypothetical protein
MEEGLILKKQRVFHLGEVKSCWGGVYDNTIERIGGNTIHAWRNKARRKYQDSIEEYEIIISKTKKFHQIFKKN